MKINFSSYSVNQLYQSLEDVNDEMYPDNAIEIYKNLLFKLNISQLDLEESGYRDSIVDDFVLSTLIGNPMKMLLFGDYWNITNELEEKIKRIEVLIEQNK